MINSDYEEFDWETESKNYLEDMKAEAEREKEAYREMAWRDYAQLHGSNAGYDPDPY